MDKYGFTKEYLLKDGRPWFPVMGEIHYSRYPEQFWKDSLYKMKAGGISVVSSYVIWIHHEEIEGEYDFSGNKNLRKFAETVESCGLKMILRIGPWCHGEVRNGGFPDWLLKKDCKVRTNDPEYLTEVEKLYRVIYGQVRGLLSGSGSGTIIGFQIENEFGHCGGWAGEEGERHMVYLASGAWPTGFSVPLYTATGGGGAVTGGLIPVMGGYCESPWDQRLTEIEPSGNYIFTYERNDHGIGSDFGSGAGITFDVSEFPYLTAELGGGMQITRHRRPVAYASDIGAMSLVKLGSGVNLLGYYMYHGGTNPDGKLSPLEESKKSGSPNALPELSYDFRAPVREYGQVSPTFRELKLFALFLRDFGTDLCTLPADIPAGNPLDPENFSDIRYSYRHNGECGYVFVSNYQRRRKMAAHTEVRLRVPGSGTGAVFPPFDMPDGDYFFFPFNMRIGGAVLRSAEASPLCVLRTGKDGENSAYVFYSRTGRPPCCPGMYLFDGIPAVPVLALSRRDALDAWVVAAADGEHLIVTGGAVYETGADGEYRFVSRRPEPLTVYPPFQEEPEGFIAGADICPRPAAEGVPSIPGRIYYALDTGKIPAEDFRIQAELVYRDTCRPGCDVFGRAPGRSFM